MRSVYFLLVFFSLLLAGSAAAQVEPVKQNRNTVKPVKKEMSVAVMAADTIMPLEISNRYKKQILQEEAKLKRAFRRDLSGELSFYSDTSYCFQCWFREDTRFKNTQKELDEYLKLLRTTNQLYSKPALSPTSRQELLDKGQLIERYRDQIIKPVDLNGQSQVGCNVVVYSASFVAVTVTVSSNKITNMQNVTIYAGTAAAVRNCNCSECFTKSTPPAWCDATDINRLKTLPGILQFKPGQMNSIMPGNYNLLVVEKVNNVDIPRYYRRWNVTGSCTIPLSF